MINSSIANSVGVIHDCEQYRAIIFTSDSPKASQRGATTWVKALSAAIRAVAIRAVIPFSLFSQKNV